MGWRIGFQLCTPTATPPLAGWLEGVWTHRADAVSVRGQARQLLAPTPWVPDRPWVLQGAGPAPGLLWRCEWQRLPRFDEGHGLGKALLKCRFGQGRRQVYGHAAFGHHGDF